MKRKLAAALTVLACLGLTGCDGGADGSTGAEAPTASAVATAGQPTASAAPAEMTLEPFTDELGFSIAVPVGWNHKHEAGSDLHIWTPDVADGQPAGGVVSLALYSTDNSAEEWFAMLHDDRRSRRAISDRRKVDVAQIGRGLRLTRELPGGQVEHEVLAAALDGVLVDLTVMPGEHLPQAYADEILDSLTREY